MLTAAKLKTLLDYDPSTGNFWWASTPNRRIVIGRPAGSRGNNRFQIRIDGKIYAAHRLAWLYVYGDWPSGDIDHIDGNPFNNQLSNLRDVSARINHQNQRRAHKRNSTGFLGVSLDRKYKGKYRARIDSTLIGYFDTPEEAHLAYVKAKRIQHEGCTI